MFETTLVGNQPKIFDGAHSVNLRVVRNKADKGGATVEDVERATTDTIRYVIEDQVTAGIDRVTDGRIRWDDPVTPFAAAHRGFEIGGLIRYFDNNVYYRRPNITNKIEFNQSAVADDFRLLADTAGDRPIMAAVCGPFSMAKFCVNQQYKTDAALYEDCAKLVARELSALHEAGAEWVQLDEPYLGFHPEEIDQAIQALRTAVDSAKVKVFVYSYFCRMDKVIGKLWDLPVAAIGADCVTVPGNLDALCDGPKGMGRGFGLLDARSTRLESLESLTKSLDKIAAKNAEQWPVCFVTPSTGLEFLPYKNTQAKMKRLTEAVRQVRQLASA